MTYIVFENEGTFDLRLLKTFGVNIKPNTDNPIGYFGTGLKYAVAIVLRNGGEFFLQDGTGELYYLGVQKSDVRGKDFPFVVMTKDRTTCEMLPFTTELGKNWQMWQAYRELYSNAVDEKGRRFKTENMPQSHKGVVRFIVKSTDMLQVYDAHGQYFLETEKMTCLYSTDKIDVYRNSTKFTYYNGIRVHEAKKPYIYTYNFKKDLQLTEDRTLASEWYRDYMLREMWADCTDPHMCKVFMCANDLVSEGSLNMADNFLGDTMFEEVTKMMEKNFNGVMRSLRDNVHARRPMKEKFKSHPLTEVQSKMFNRAIDFLGKAGYEMSRYPIVCVDNLGKNIMGMADDGHIYIAQLAFNKGAKQVVATLLEEWIHCEYLVKDYTHEMQDKLFDIIVTMMEDKLGEPI